MSDVSYDETWARAIKSYDSGDVSGALFLFKKMARQGYSPAALAVGSIYEHGNSGVPKDIDTAIDYYLRALNATDDVKAHLALGRCYLTRGKTQSDYQKARYHFINLIEDRNHRGSLYGLGVIYEHGLGVEQSYGYANQFYQEAVDQGHLLAKRNMARIFLKQGSYLKGVWLWLKASMQIMRVGTPNIGDDRLGIR